jgi:hypothetical protein
MNQTQSIQAAMAPKRYVAKNTRTGLYFGGKVFNATLQAAMPMSETEALFCRHVWANVELETIRETFSGTARDYADMHGITVEQARRKLNAMVKTGTMIKRVYLEMVYRRFRGYSGREMPVNVAYYTTV